MESVLLMKENTSLVYLYIFTYVFFQLRLDIYSEKKADIVSECQKNPKTNPNQKKKSNNKANKTPQQPPPKKPTFTASVLI